jgi:hypothetical protein
MVGMIQRLQPCKQRLANMEKDFENMETSICKHDKKDEYLEENMIYMCQTFNASMEECHKTTYLLAADMNLNVNDRLKVVEDLFNYVMEQIKYQEDMINILK